MVYLNHAATTWPKPFRVTEAVARAMREPPETQYRGSSPEGNHKDSRRLCRGNLARLFGVKKPERIFFTSGATQALNMAILGFQSDRKRIVYTAAEHNAVLRTIYDGLGAKIAEGSCLPVKIPCDRGGYADMEAMERSITEDTALVIANHSSNVTGAVQEIAQIGRWCRGAGACLLVDASQSAGALPIDVDDMGIDMLAFTGHKGLYGPQGTGGLYVRSGIALRPLLYGGTGIDSSTLVPKEPFYEVGTANQPGIAGLNAGAEYILETGLEKIRSHEQALMELLYRGLGEIPGVTVYGDRVPEGTALSFNLEGLRPADVGYILAEGYGIQVRTGLHCAPLIHEYLGTARGGTVRASISYLSTEEDIRALLDAVGELAGNL